MFSPVQTQDDLVGVLLSDQRLANCAVKSYRRMLLNKELDYRLVLEGRGPGARTGSGLLVPMPTGISKNPNITGPVLDWMFPVISIENPTISQVPETGTLLSAEELAQLALDILQLYADEKVGTFFVDPTVIQPEKEYVFPGCIGYRTTLHVVGRSQQTARVNLLSSVIVDNGNGTSNITLSTVTAGAHIKYTMDGSFPSDDVAGNSASLTYNSAITVPAGTVVRAAGYKLGLINSTVKYIQL